ncbi:stalk domain-containing protein [Paenibacillus guangzhouensis]|uniref:stalk domain-containing protein n=1 Tax=Paenibacillus guangzhouensis TaxID=1473112 RepID=UPI001266A94E|nr:stalk domain-containing protein [Paenibacillus guangzhouensis]
MKKKFVLTLTCASLLVGISTGVYAATNLKKIEAYINTTMKVRVNGKAVQLNDDKGLALQPITYNGNTYVPVKGLGNAMNVPVIIDSKTNEVIVGEKVNGTPLNAEKFDSIHSTKDPAQTTFQGKNYKEAWYNHTDSDPQAPSLFMTPNKKYQKLYLKMAAIDQEITDVKITDLDNNVLLKDVGTISVSDGMKDIEVDIGGVKTVVVEFQLKQGGGYLVPLIASYYK